FSTATLFTQGSRHIFSRRHRWTVCCQRDVTSRFNDAGPRERRRRAGEFRNFVTELKLTAFPVAALRFKKDHRIVAGNRLAQHPVRIDRVARVHYSQARRVRKKRFWRLTVMLNSTDPAA